MGTVIDTLKTLTAMNVTLLRKYPGLASTNLLDVLINVRSRSLMMNGYMVLSPIFDSLSKSAEPNCSVEGLHLTHRQESFLLLKTLRDIKEGEELTISHNGLSNLEMYFRYGKILANNPNNMATIKAKYDSVLNCLDELFEVKEQFFKDLGGLKDFLKISKDGVDEKTMQLLRIFFLTTEDILQNKQIAAYSPANFEAKISDQN